MDPAFVVSIITAHCRKEESKTLWQSMIHEVHCDWARSSLHARNLLHVSRSEIVQSVSHALPLG